MALITFWLKLFVALAFAAVVLLLDPLLRDKPAMRLRAHLLWSVNPLLLWEIVASGHIDGLAAAFGVAGLAALRFTADGGRPTLARCAAAGTLLGGRGLHQVPVRALPGRPRSGRCGAHPPGSPACSAAGCGSP